MNFVTENIGYIRTMLLCAAILLFFVSIYLFAAHAVADRYAIAKMKLQDKLFDMMHNVKKDSIFSYENIQQRLDAWGVTYYSKGKITPLVYLSGKLFCAAAGFAAGMIFYGMTAAFILTAAAYLYPDVRAKLRNRRDNVKMLKSVMDVYDVVFLQTDAGEYITRTLIDAYRVASHPRLKAALITLTGDILSSNDLIVSVEVFAGKFENENIDNLVVTVKQLAQNDASMTMLEDIRGYLRTLMEISNRYEQERLRRMGDACLFAIFFCMMAVLVYAGVKGLLDSAVLFKM